MVTFRNNTRRNNFRRNDRSFKVGGERNKYNNFSNNDTFQRKISGRNNQNASKLVEKYNNLAREALSSGDKILSENYLQHADHFSRILSLQEVSKSTEEKNNIIEQNFSKSSKDINDKKDNISNLENLDTD